MDKSVFYSAEAFHITAELVKDVPLLQGRQTPFIVNAMFAIELYLKSFDSKKIYAKEVSKDGITVYEAVGSKTKYEHDLVKLFNNLGDEVKSRLDKLWFESFCAERTLLSFLETHKDLFVSQRYFYELQIYLNKNEKGEIKESIRNKKQMYKPKEVMDVMDVLNRFGKQVMNDN